MNDLQTPARQNLGPLPKVLLFLAYIYTPAKLKRSKVLREDS